MVFPLWAFVYFEDLMLYLIWFCGGFCSRMYGLLGFEGFGLFCFVVLRFFLWCAWSVFFHQIALFWFFLSFVDSLAGFSLLWGNVFALSVVFLQNYDWLYVIWHNLFVSWYYVDIQKLVRFLLVFGLWILFTGSIQYA